MELIVVEPGVGRLDYGAAMADARYKAAFEAALEEVEGLTSQLAEKQRFANLLAGLAGIDPPFTEVTTPGVSSAPTIRADQFANFPAPSVAARAFLGWRGQAKGSAELGVIYDALEKGGFRFGSTKNEAKGGLRIALGKDGLIHKLPNGTYGLKEWYPNARKTAKKGTDGGREDEEAEPSEEVGPDSQGAHGAG